MFNRSVDSILKSFTKIENQLHRLVEKKDKEIEKKTAEIVSLQDKTKTAINERVRAQKVAAKIHELVE